MRKGMKTTEFWLTLFMAVLTVVQKQLWPDSPIPSESFVAVVAWVISRFGEKVLSEMIAKRAWATSEFWVAIGFAVIKYIFPALPGELLIPTMAYIVGRPVIKVTEDFELMRKFR